LCYFVYIETKESTFWKTSKSPPHKKNLHININGYFNETLDCMESCFEHYAHIVIDRVRKFKSFQAILLYEKINSTVDNSVRKPLLYVKLIRDAKIQKMAQK
jgi:hypothetical protein